jgi:hypothetical protein
MLDFLLDFLGDAVEALIDVAGDAIVGAAVGVAAAGAVAVVGAIVIKVAELTIDEIRKRLRKEISEADYAIIQEIKDKGQVVTGPPYVRVKTYKNSGQELKEAKFEYDKRANFRINEKIII